MYNKVDTNLNFMEREKNVEQFWRDNDIFKKSMEQRKQGPTYTFYDGPPTANGKPHIGHLETRVIKDMIPRYRTMKGYYVPRKAGWDTHGLPVELVRIRSNSRDWFLLLINVRKASGSTRVCGKNFLIPLVSGQIWTIPTLPMMITISNPSGGH